MRECIRGEIQLNNEWFVCGVGTYSIELGSKIWKKCHTGAEWYGNNTMVPLEGYWRAKNSSDSFFKCPYT